MSPDEAYGIAFELLMVIEGFTANNQNDRGGPTAYGIASRFWPVEYRHIMRLQTDAERRAYAREFYYQHFWRPLKPDTLGSLWIAMKLLDISVNAGADDAGRILQLACNDMLPGLRQYVPLKVDGVIGPKTRARVRALARRYEPGLMAAFCARQTRFYQEEVDRHPDQAGNLCGWLKRGLAPPGFVEQVILAA